MTPSKPGNVVIMVTKDDIAKGTCGDPEYCPVARAATRLITGNVIVHVRRGTMHVFYGSKRGWREYPLPTEVTDKIVLFDTERKMDPFHFEVTP